MQVTILNGLYRGTEVHNQTFELVTEPKQGAKGWTVSVRPNEEINFNGNDKLRINITKPEDVVYPEGYSPMMLALSQPTETTKAVKAALAPVAEETDDQIMARIQDRFEILEEMTGAAMEGNVRGMIVVGPPGVGKSYGVEKQLNKGALFDNIKGDTQSFEIAKGAMTPIGLYQVLYHNSSANNVLVFDDCDSILDDELSLNLLKAALDSGGKRTLSWHSASHTLVEQGIPNKFDFKGSVIFITNLNFDNIKSKKKEAHLAALQSRCHYLDLTMRTMRDRVLRIKQIHQTGELFRSYRFKNNEGDEVVEFMFANQDRLREMSLRMALKIADLFKVSDNWKRLAESTVMKNSF